MQGPITNESLRAIYREIMSSALSLEKSMTIAYLGPEATFTHQAAIRRFGSSLRYSRAENHRRCVHRSQQEPRGLWRRAGREFHGRRRDAHARHVRRQRSRRSSRKSFCRCSIACSAIRRATRSKSFTRIRNRSAQCRAWVQNNLPHVEIIETSSNARSAELAAQRKGHRGHRRHSGRGEVYGCTCWNRTSRTTPRTPRASSCWAASAVRRRGNDRTSLMSASRDKVGALHHALAPFRQIPDQHDEDRIAPEQAQSVGIFLLRRLRRPRQQDRKVAKAIAAPGRGMQLRESARVVSERRITRSDLW